MVLKRQKVLFYNVSNFKCFVSVIYHLFKNSFLTPLCFFPCPSVSSSLNWLVLHVTQSYTIASHYFISLFIQQLRQLNITTSFTISSELTTRISQIPTLFPLDHLTSPPPKKSLLVFTPVWFWSMAGTLSFPLYCPVLSVVFLLCFLLVFVLL